MKTNHRITSARHAFTLVELLVVIVIIAVLSSLGFMGSRKMIDRASKAKSTGNIRQLIMAAQTFSSENNGVIMNWRETITTVNGVTSKRSWSDHMLLTLSPQLATSGNQAKNAYAKGIGIFGDPKALKQGKGKLPTTGTNSWRTYAYNNRIGVADPETLAETEYLTGARNVNQVDSPDRLILLSQRILNGSEYLGFLEPEAGGKGEIAFELYSGTALVGFLDGHVESFTKKNYPHDQGGNINPKTGKAYTSQELHDTWFGN